MNNKPRYTRDTTRYQIVNLLHITTVLTPRTYKLFDNPQQMANVMVKLKKEGVVEKSHNEEIFENFAMSSYESNLDKYFYDNIPDENIDFYMQYGVNDLKKAKYSKDNNINKTRRTIRNSEVISIMFASGIPTLPSDKKYVVKNKTLTDNVYYQSREIKRYAGYKDDIEISEDGKTKTAIASRMNGTLLTAGGNYNIYHIGKGLENRIWFAQGEYKIKNFIQNMLANYINKGECILDNAILLSYDLEVFLKLVKPTKTLKESYEGLNQTYKNLYVLPYDKNGKDMIKIMAESNWEYNVKAVVTDETPEDTKLLDVTCDYYDGEIYTFIFCVPNIARYIEFTQKAKLENDKSRFRVVCFDWQVDFVLNSIGKYAKVLKADFNDFKKDWYRTKNESNQKGIKSK